MATMPVDTNIYTLQIPVADRQFFMSLVKRMGWIAKKTKTISSIPPETLSAIEEARSGKDAGIVNMDSIDSFIRSME